MPELPEVETTLRGIAHAMDHASVDQVIVRQDNLRWKIPANLSNKLSHSTITHLARRGKYLVFETTSQEDNHKGWMLIHLGMSGSLKLVNNNELVKKHDHADFVLDSGFTLRYNDPRRFGSILWTDDTPEKHPLLAKLGPEPLTRNFNAAYLFEKAKNRHAPIKSFIMNNAIVVGVGNIYATEALFKAHILPDRQCSDLSLYECDLLCRHIKIILQKAIKVGGTTLKDFETPTGKPGYFKQQLNVYGRAGKACPQCKNPLSSKIIGQRSSVFCEHCQH